MQKYYHFLRENPIFPPIFPLLFLRERQYRWILGCYDSKSLIFIRQFLQSNESENQFRLFLGVGAGTKKDKKTKEIFEFGKSIGWFCDKKGSEIFGNKTSLRNEYCSYSNRWVYQYFNLSENDKQYAKLKESIRHFLKIAFESIPKIDKEFL